MTRSLRTLAPCLPAILCLTAMVAAEDVSTTVPVVSIKSLTSSILPEKTRIVVETSAPLALPSSYNLDPLVLVLDIPDADATALAKQYTVGSQAVDRINVYQLQEEGRKAITRLEIIMAAVVPYRIYSDEGRLYVDFEHLDRTTAGQGVKGKKKVEEFFEPKPEQPRTQVAQPSATAPASVDSRAKPALSEAGRVNSIDVHKESGRLSVVVDYHGRVDYKAFELKSPDRLVVDLINAVNAVPVDTIAVRSEPVNSIRIAQFQSGQPKIARVVFDLSSRPDYSIVPAGNQLTIVFKSTEAAEAAPPATEQAAMAETEVAARNGQDPTAASATEQAAGRGQEMPMSAPVQQESESTVEIAPVAVPPSTAVASDSQVEGESGTPVLVAVTPEIEEQPKPLDDTGISAGRSRKTKGIEMAEVPPPLPAGEEPLSSGPPATPPPLTNTGTRFESQTITEGETTYSGDPINLDLVDAPIEQVFRLISEISGLNVITDPGVTGRVTVNFKGVPWDQALDLILKTNGLGYVLENRVVRISKLEVLAGEEEKKRRLRDAKLLSVELKTITRSLSYAKVADMEPVLKKMLSQRGEIITDSRTNTLIVSDIPDKVASIDKLIESLDTATPQVTIQAKIVESSANYTQHLGIQWGFQAVADARHGNQTSLQFPSHILVDGGAIGATQGLIGPLGGYAVDVPAAAFNSGIGISVGNVLDTFMLDAALTALEGSGRGRILSAPKVTTQNNMRASIIQGREIPVQTTANNTTTTTFKNAALELNVTPQITAEGTIIMVVDIKNDQADFGNLVNGIPPIITQKAQTTVLVNDGGTSVIGGIYRAEDSFSQSKVPGLHKLPILGYLFRNSSKTRVNRELLIFLTPRIVRQ